MIKDLGIQYLVSHYTYKVEYLTPPKLMISAQMTLEDSLMVWEYIWRCDGRPYTAADFSVQKIAT